jgi:methylamine dehydrogenase accessory protein MauD
MLFVSQALLWLVVLLLSVAVLALARQVGVLHSRISPIGALSIGRGPQPGERAPEITAETLSKAKTTIGGRSRTARLLFFVSPNCPICKSLLPTVKSVAVAETLDLTLIGDGDAEELRGMARQFDIPFERFVNSADVGRAFHVGKLPYAVLLNESGVIAAQGLVNTREHVESLAAAHETGHHSVQDYLRNGTQKSTHDHGAA